ncbi:protein ACCELERATED CELL DEATH 6 [Eucalyptus grandis]|uniref:protein ACCELERATED CELL DEATH 6 n=1 Tax=Eucalyptus grandis TaxID=71139 RepID=UPI00192EF154|nr:protein ACCELERATED CELL DEATH 6 [Eucalyptus grandis]
MLKEIIYRLPKLLPESDENGWTPLQWAASVGEFEAMELLLRKFPYLALQKDNDGSYPIHVASKPEAGITYTVQWVLKYYGGPDRLEKLVNSKDDDGKTPLHLASMRNHCKVMRLLTKDKRIDLQLENKGGLTALDVAMESRSLSTRNSALLGRAILIVAGVPRSEGQDVVSPREQGSGASKSSLAKWIKEQVNTLLLVATLVASITFTAGLTLPGGYNASSDLHPRTATMLHYRMFRVFIIANMLAMYSSILAVVVLLCLNRDFYIAELAYHLAGPLLLMALTGMSVAFFAAVTVAVSKLIWLESLVLSVGVLYLMIVVVVLVALIFPFSKTTMSIVVFYYRAVSIVEFWKESSPLYLAVEDEHTEILALPLAIPFGPSRIQGMSPVRAVVTHWNLVNFSFKFPNEKSSWQALIQG